MEGSGISQWHIKCPDRRCCYHHQPPCQQVFVIGYEKCVLGDARYESSAWHTVCGLYEQNELLQHDVSVHPESQRELGSSTWWSGTYKLRCVWIHCSKSPNGCCIVTERVELIHLHVELFCSTAHLANWYFGLRSPVPCISLSLKFMCIEGAACLHSKSPEAASQCNSCFIKQFQSIVHMHA